MRSGKFWIAVALIALLATGYMVYQQFESRPMTASDSGSPEPLQRKISVEEERLTLHQLCRYADSVGIDTGRFASRASDPQPELDRKLTALLMEVRYGKKPSRLTYTGLRETLDPQWTQKAAVDFSPALLKEVSPFGPYNQLVGHYNQLRDRTPVTPGMADTLRLIRQTLNFYRYTNRFGTDPFVLVNIPAGELNVFDRKGTRLLPMQVIAGRYDRRTPCMTTYIKDIVMYPYWNVPKNIVLDEMLPRMQRDLSYIYNQNLQILDDRGRELDPEEIDWDGLSTNNFPYRVRQASGCDNSLGLLKFNLENPLAIYLHDTNSRDLFTLTADRWRSHGCVRVQKPVELANLVLGKPTFDAGFMNRCLVDQKPRTLPLPKPVPVFIAYNTADVDSTGALRVYRDVYALDKQ